jgi:hypothetical protein
MFVLFTCSVIMGFFYPPLWLLSPVFLVAWAIADFTKSTNTYINAFATGFKKMKLRPCPHCRSEVDKQATVCPHCRRDMVAWQPDKQPTLYKDANHRMRPIEPEPPKDPYYDHTTNSRRFRKD